MESETDLFEGALFPLVAMFSWSLMVKAWFEQQRKIYFI